MRRTVALKLAFAVVLSSCAQRIDPIIEASAVEAIHVDAQSARINMTVVDASGRRSTIAFTPRSALQAQQELARTMAMVVDSAAALRAQQQSPTPAP